MEEIKKLEVGDYVIAPLGSFSSLTSGDRYEVIEVDYGGFKIIGDYGLTCYCHLNSCAFLDGGDWIIDKDLGSKPNGRKVDELLLETSLRIFLMGGVSVDYSIEEAKGLISGCSI